MISKLVTMLGNTSDFIWQLKRLDVPQWNSEMNALDSQRQQR